MARKKRWHVHEKVFVVLLLVVMVLVSLNVAQANGLLVPHLGGIVVEDGTVRLDSMSLEQKVAQMVIVVGHRSHLPAWKRMQVGGVHLLSLETEHIYNNTIIDFQHGQDVPFFITSDLEGCVSPFGHIKSFTPASDVDTIPMAFEKGSDDGEFLKKLGFNLNFAPVVDLEDSIWRCRSFPGNETEIATLAHAYAVGLQENGVLATAKHYPGKTLVVRDPHKFLVTATIDGKDVFPYRFLSSEGEVAAVMVSHIITSGEIDSRGVPSVVSASVISGLREDFDGLIISDEIHMLGLKSFYKTLDEMYIAVFKAGNDIILNFDYDPNEVYRMITVIVDAVERGEISEEQIDASVTRILEAKGFTVV